MRLPRCATGPVRRRSKLKAAWSRSSICALVTSRSTADRFASRLEDVNLVVPGGTTVALVGRSGAGKTTLASLIPRFYELAAGRILIDGTDISTVTLGDFQI